VLWSALPIVKHAKPNCAKNYDVELPPLPPKKKFIKIPDTTNSGIISGFNMN